MEASARQGPHLTRRPDSHERPLAARTGSLLLSGSASALTGSRRKGGGGAWVLEGFEGRVNGEPARWARVFLLLHDGALLAEAAPAGAVSVRSEGEGCVILSDLPTGRA